MFNEGNQIHNFMSSSGSRTVITLLRIRDPGLGTFLTPGSGIRDPGWKKVSIRIQDPGSVMNNPDHIF
jgi:hypothetical protein